MKLRFSIVILGLICAGCLSTRNQSLEAERCQSSDETEKRVAQVMEETLSKIEDLNLELLRLTDRVTALEAAGTVLPMNSDVKNHPAGTHCEDCFEAFTFLAEWSDNSCNTPDKCLPQPGDRVDLYESTAKKRDMRLIYESAILLGFQVQPNGDSDPNSSVTVLVASANKAKLEGALSAMRDIILKPRAKKVITK